MTLQPTAQIPQRSLYDAILQRSRQLVLAIMALTAIYGVVLAIHFVSVNASGHAETDLAAINLAQRGYIGNPYGPITGPTAHVPPGLIVIMAAVYRLLGPATPIALIALSSINIIIYFSTQYVLVKILDIRRAPAIGYLVLAGLFLVTMTSIYENTIAYRQWDQPYSALVLILAWMVAEMAFARPAQYKDVAWLGLLAVVGSLFSVAVVPAIIAVAALVIWQMAPAKKRLVAAAMGVAIVVAGMLPWAVRNEIMLHKFILTRSNFPLEFALGNMPGANDGLTGNMEEFVSHHHPSFSKEAAQDMARLGEAQFMQDIATLSYSYVWAHPAEFARLTLLRIRYLIIPSIRMVYWHPLIGAPVILASLMVLALLHWASLGAAWWLDRTLFYRGVALTVVPLLPYIITHVEYRYIYIINFTVMILIVLAVLKLLEIRAAHRPALRLR